MAPKMKDPVVGAPKMKAVAEKPQTAKTFAVTATPVTKSATKTDVRPVPVKAVQQKPPTESIEIPLVKKIKVKARKITSPVPATTKKQARADDPTPDAQPLQKKAKKQATQADDSKKAAEEMKKKLATDAAAKKAKALEEAQARAVAMEQRKVALEAERKRIEEEEARMAAEETERLQEEERLAASLAVEEQVMEPSESEEKIEEEDVEDPDDTTQPEEVAQPEEGQSDEQDGSEQEEENVNEVDLQETEDGAPLLDNPDDAAVQEEPTPPEQAGEEQDTPIPKRAVSEADDEEIREITAEEVPASKRQSQGVTASTMPSRINPRRKAKGASTPIIPMFTSSRKDSPKARRKVDFPQEGEGELEVGQAEEMVSPMNHTDKPAQSTTEPEAVTESLEGEEGANLEMGSGGESTESDRLEEELQGEAPQREAADEILDEETVIKERARKGKGKALPTEKRRKEARVTRRTRGPVIREPVEQVAPEDSDQSDEELEETTDYEVYPTEINNDVLDALRKYNDLQLKEGTKDESKAYGSGYLVDVDSLLKLGILSEVADKMVRIEWGWLLTLDEYRIPRALCKEFISTFTFTGTTNLSAVSIQFDLFRERRVMSIDE